MTGTETRSLQDEILTWLRVFEQSFNEKGRWNQPQALYLMSTDIVEGRDSGQFAEMPTPHIENAPAPEYLAFLAKTFREERLLREAIRKRCSSPAGVLGVVFVTEAWVIPPKDLKRWAGRNWGEHPKRRSKRMVVGVDIFGTGYWVTRYQDRPKEVECAHGTAGGQRRYDGGLVDALTDIVKALA